MRRRLLLGGVKYVFSAATSVSIGNTSGVSSFPITSTDNGQNIGYTVVSYDGPVTAVTTAATYFTIEYSENPVFSDRNGSVVLKQNESQEVLTISVTQAAQEVRFTNNMIILDGSNGSTGYVQTNCGNNVHFYDTVATKFVTGDTSTSDGRFIVTATSANNTSQCRATRVYLHVNGDIRNYLIGVIQLPSSFPTIDGYQYTDAFGLKWAIKNVGASSMSDPGKYYVWGAGSTEYVVHGQNDNFYTEMADLPSDRDTATQVMGGGWRMPTKEEIDALTDSAYSIFSNAYIRKANYNGTYGTVFYDGTNEQKEMTEVGNCLFFPDGWYESRYADAYRDDPYFWSKNYFNDSLSRAYIYGGTTPGPSWMHSGGITSATYRNNGLHVRGVFTNN